MKKIQYILFAMVYLVTLAACGGGEEFANSHTPTLHVTVGDFSGFSDGLSRAIGTSDPGKTAWTAGDELLVKVTFYHDAAKTSAVQTTTTLLTYYDNRWALTDAVAWPFATVAATLTAYYAPDYTLSANSGNLTLKASRTAGCNELLTSTDVDLTRTLSEANISFSNRRHYSRLRVVAPAGSLVTLTSCDFLANDGSTAIAGISTTADTNGNAFFYGTCKAGSEIKVSLKSYEVTKTISSAWEQDKSYVMNLLE